MGSVYKVVMYIPIPLINGERVSARLITLPFVLFILASVYAFQRFLDKQGGSPALRWSALVGLFLLAHDLWQHLKLWRVNVAAQYFPVTPVDLSIKLVSNHPDPSYTTSAGRVACHVDYGSCAGDGMFGKENLRG
jgi:hypothetical protein